MVSTRESGFPHEDRGFVWDVRFKYPKEAIEEKRSNPEKCFQVARIAERNEK